MTGRGIDQILLYPGDPTLHESSVCDAREYVRLAERCHGPIPRRVPFNYIWENAIDEFARVSPDLRIVNLETAVTNLGD
jgi:poly-gamma-glutamate synthesis protein (capsule biosynthesis protein)